MPMSRDTLFKYALELEQQDRADLAKLLIDSLDPATEQDVREAWMRDIERRTAELDSGTVQTIPWDTARARVRSWIKESERRFAEIESGTAKTTPGADVLKEARSRLK